MRPHACRIINIFWFSPGCCTAKNKVVSSGVKLGPVISASTGAEANW